MTDPTPMSSEEWAPIAEALSRHRPLSSVAVDGALLARIVATVDAERARADQAEAERTALVARLHQWASEWLCHLPTTARMHVAFRRALDASPTEGNPE